MHSETLAENTTDAASTMLDHDKKRSRRADWPVDGTKIEHQAYSNSTNPSPSLLQDLRSQSFARGSKFIEGSMGSRLNGPPPSLYTREEVARVNNGTDGEDGQIIGSLEELYISYDAGIEPAKSSGMLRLGKALSDAFAPVWHGLSGRKDKKPEAKSGEDNLQSRQVKAEKVYMELKKTGFKGTQWALRSKSRLSLDTIKRGMEETRTTQSMAPMESPIDTDRGCHSADNRKSMVSTIDQASLVPSTNTGSPSIPIKKRKSAFLLRKPSFPTLKKVKSHLVISSNKNESTSTLGPVSFAGAEASNSVVNRSVLRPQPSKKDLQKQHRLSKKVSDLETKLETARRNLMLATDQGPQVPEKPTRKPFVPGALASLPSERLLSRNSLFGEQSKGGFKSRNLSTASDGFQIWTEEAIGGSAENLVNTEPQDDGTTPTKSSALEKREAFGEITPNGCRPSQAKDSTLSCKDIMVREGIENEDPRTTTRSQMKRGKPKHRKLARVDKFGSPSSTPPDPDFKPSPSPSVFNPANVDTAKLMALRANPDSTKTFGQLTDDIKLLRQEFPDITNDQVMKYISGILTDDKKLGFRLGRNTHKVNVLAATKLSTDYTCLSHQDHPPAPTLSRPRSVSPRKRRQSVSPPPSGERLKIAITDFPVPPVHRSPTKDRDDDFITISPSKDKNVPPVPKVPKELEGQAAKIKPDMAIKEDDEFQWDDDVF
ncbi:MAG: hypothetical protein MMC33_007580 [Icmadophila ericetorum]|nr:hypothetical protein [Icmadophila ericetorum]